MNTTRKIDPADDLDVEDILPQTEILAQLAEECAELSQAALKLRRSYDRRNPTRTARHACKQHFIEECADVLLTLNHIYMYQTHIDDIDLVIETKENRWREALRYGTLKRDVGHCATCKEIAQGRR